MAVEAVVRPVVAVEADGSNKAGVHILEPGLERGLVGAERGHRREVSTGGAAGEDEGRGVRT